MYADTHCHLNHEDFDSDWDDVLTRAQDAGVSRLLCIGYDEASSRRAVDIACNAPGVYAAIGLHPDAGEAWDDACASRLRALYEEETARIKAYGEIGLDYHWDTLPRPRQRDVFAAQVQFAASLSPTLPLVIHCREAQGDPVRHAQADILAVLRETGTQASVVMHCFTGDWDDARACLDANCWLGIGGVATFKKSDALRDALARTPLTRLLLETDCPYLAPQPWRGRRNEPSYLPAIARTVAETRGITPEAIAEATMTNALALFSLA